MLAAEIVKVLKGTIASAALAQGHASLDTLDTALDGARSAAQLAKRIGGRLHAGPEAMLAMQLTTAVGEGGDSGERLLLLQQMVELSLPTPRDLAGLGLNAPAIAEAMCARLRRPEGARPEDYAFLHSRFAALVTPALRGLIDDPAFIAAITPQLWQRLYDQLEEMPRRIVNELDQREAGRAATAEGITRFAVIQLAKRITPDVPDEVAALRELERAVEVAIRVQREGVAGFSADAFVDEVLRRVAELNREGLIDQGSAEIEQALKEHRERSEAGELRLLHLAEEQAILRRDASSAVRHILRRLELEHPDPVQRLDPTFVAFNVWFSAGRNRQLPFDMEVAALLAEVALSLATSPIQRSAALRNRGMALSQLGRLLHSTQRFGEAEKVLIQALEETPRETYPLDWAQGVGLLGNLYGMAVELGAGDAFLSSAIDHFHSSLEMLRHDNAIQQWCDSITGLAACLILKGDRHHRVIDLQRAVSVLENALRQLPLTSLPEKRWEMKINIGNALWSLGNLANDGQVLGQARDTYRELGELSPRDAAPGLWALAMHNLAGAEFSLFLTLGDRQVLREAVEHARAAVTVYRELGALGQLARAEARLAEIEAARPE